MYIVELTEDKVEHLSEHLEKGLRHIGKAMQCIDAMKEHHDERMPREDHEFGDRIHREGRDRIWEEHDMGERMIGRGRYSRY